MDEKENRSLDILGIKPVGEAINTVVKSAVDGAAAFLSRICLPASEEFGLLLRDKVSHWRAQNLVKVAEKAERKLSEVPNSDKKHAHPRIASLTLENGSWSDTDEVQGMWAGLLVSSCTEDGKDDSNLIFINLLTQLTTVEAKVLNYACEKSKKKFSRGMSFVYAEELTISAKELTEVCGTSDIYRLDRELDHLRALELLIPESGFPLIEFDETEKNEERSEEDASTGEEQLSSQSLENFGANITPSPLGLNFYIRCQGSVQSPIEFFALGESK